MTFLLEKSEDKVICKSGLSGLRGYVHLEIGVQAMSEIDERGDKVRHFEW